MKTSLFSRLKWGSSECPHNLLGFTILLQMKYYLNGIINSTTGKYWSVAFRWMVTLTFISFLEELFLHGALHYWILCKLWWFFLCRVLRRVVRLLSHCSVLEASNEASLRQAQSASDQCKRLMDENEELKKVICKLKSQGKKWLCKDSTSIGDPAVFALAHK